MTEKIGTLEKHVLPNGTAVYYRDSDHSYWRDAKENPTIRGGWSGVGRLSGVSTVVKPLDFRPDGLMRWAAKLNGKGVAELASTALGLNDVDAIRTELHWLESGDAIWAALEQAGLLYDQAKDRAATKGTNVHELALQALAEGRQTPRLADMTVEERGYAQAVIKFWLEHEPRPLQAEQVVADVDLGVAGRFDLRAALHGGYCGEALRGAICLLDAKTGGYRTEKEHAQLSGYDLLAERCGVGASDRLFILQLFPDGEYRLIEGQGTRDAFLNAAATYRHASEIGKASRRERNRVDDAQQAMAA